MSVETHAGQDGVGVTLVNLTAVHADVERRTETGRGRRIRRSSCRRSFAVEQEKHSTLSEVDPFRRDMLGTFIPRELDLDLSYSID